jgi:hypothetical protein
VGKVIRVAARLAMPAKMNVPTRKLGEMPAVARRSRLRRETKARAHPIPKPVGSRAATSLVRLQLSKAKRVAAHPMSKTPRHVAAINQVRVKSLVRHAVETLVPARVNQAGANPATVKPAVESREKSPGVRKGAVASRETHRPVVANLATNRISVTLKLVVLAKELPVVKLAATSKAASRAVNKVDSKGVSREDNKAGSRVVNREVSKVDNKAVSKVDSREASKVDNRVVSKAGNKAGSKVDNRAVNKGASRDRRGVLGSRDSNSSRFLAVNEWKMLAIISVVPNSG